MTKIEQRIWAIQNNRKKRLKKLIAMLKTSVNRIKKQGTGCNIPGLGAGYKHENLRDAIAILLAPSVVRNKTYGCISDDEQAYLVTAIARTYSFSLDDATERNQLKDFLQELQDIHDDAFDEFNQVEGDRMTKFLNDCKLLEENLITELNHAE